MKMERKYHHDFKDLEVFCCSNLNLVLEIELTTGRFWHVCMLVYFSRGEQRG